MRQEKRGGLRNPPGGRPKKDETRITVSVMLSKANAKYLRSLGRAKNDHLNSLLDKEREKINQQ